MEYSLNSEFDIEMHKKTFVNYLEVLIENNGHVVYAVPSHQELAIKMACKALHLTRKQLEDICPPEYYFNFLEWVLSKINAISVWNEMYMGNANTKQKEKLLELKKADLYKGSI